MYTANNALCVHLSDAQLSELAFRIAHELRGIDQESIGAKPMAAVEPLIAREDAAKAIGVSLNHLAKMTRMHGLRHYKLGKRVMYRLSEVIEDIQVAKKVFEAK